MSLNHHNGAMSLKDKRLNLIRAAQDLCIDKDSFCLFLQAAIEAEQCSLDAIAKLIPSNDLLNKERGLAEARLILCVLKDF